MLLSTWKVKNTESLYGHRIKCQSCHREHVFYYKISEDHGPLINQDRTDIFSMSLKQCIRCRCPGKYDPKERVRFRENQSLYKRVLRGLGAFLAFVLAMAFVLFTSLVLRI